MCSLVHCLCGCFTWRYLFQSYSGCRVFFLCLCFATTSSKLKHSRGNCMVFKPITCILFVPRVLYYFAFALCFLYLVVFVFMFRVHLSPSNVSRSWHRVEIVMSRIYANIGGCRFFCIMSGPQLGLSADPHSYIQVVNYFFSRATAVVLFSFKQQFSETVQENPLSPVLAVVFYTCKAASFLN